MGSIPLFSHILAGLIANYKLITEIKLNCDLASYVMINKSIEAMPLDFLNNA